jgi:hypothetical protein
MLIRVDPDERHVRSAGGSDNLSDALLVQRESGRRRPTEGAGMHTCRPFREEVERWYLTRHDPRLQNAWNGHYSAFETGG